jgi:hypothetical protein
MITKYNSGPLGISEAADALLDPKSAFRYFLDFISDVEDGQYVSTAIAGSATAAIQSAHGGTVLLSTVGTTAGDGAIVGSPNDLIVLDGGRFVYAEARIQFSSTSASWYFGLTADAPATTEWSTAAIAPGGAAVLVGLDAGTDSLTGAVAGKSLQLSTYGSSHVETLIPLDFTLAADTYYRVGFVIQGWTVQVFVNGKKYGPATKINSNVTTAMGVQVSCVTRGTTARTLTCDYIDVVCTR